MIVDIQKTDLILSMRRFITGSLQELPIFLEVENTAFYRTFYLSSKIHNTTLTLNTIVKLNLS